jgi:hypothetical protein
MADETEHDPGFGPYTRDETEAHRLDRNFAEQLQELRVAQTGVQILFAFLLAIAFQQRFGELSTGQRALYLVTLLSAAMAAVLLIAPAATHRILFGRHRKDEVVGLTKNLLTGGLIFLAISILSAVVLVVDFVADGVVAAVVTSILGVVVLTTWVVIPFVTRRRPDHKRLPI